MEDERVGSRGRAFGARRIRPRKLSTFSNVTNEFSRNFAHNQSYHENEYDYAAMCTAQ